MTEPDSVAAGTPPRTPVLPRVLIVVLTLWALIGYLIVPWLVHAFAPGLTADALDAELEIGDVHFDPFALRLRLHEIVLHGPLDATNFEAEPLVRVRLLDLNLSALSLLTLDLSLEVGIDAPDLRVELDENGAPNLMALLPTAPDPKPVPAEAGAALPDLTVSLRIVDGRVHFIDRSRAQPFETRINDIDFALESLHLQAGEASSVGLAAELEGARLEIAGELGTRPEARLDVRLSDFPLTLVNRWLIETTPAHDLRGQLDAAARLTFMDGALRLADGEATLNGLAVSVHEPLQADLTVEQIAVRAVAGNLLQPDLEIGSLQVREPSIAAILDQDSVAALTAPAPTPDDAAPSEPRSEVPEAAPEDAPEAAPAELVEEVAQEVAEEVAEEVQEDVQGETRNDGSTATASGRTGATPAARITVGAMRIEDMALAVTDRTIDGAPTLAVDRINVELGRIVPLGGGSDTAPTPLHVDLRAFGSGELTFDGTVALAPRLSGRLELAGGDLTALAPWVQHHLQLGLQSGAVELGMDVEYAESLLLNGDLHLANLALDDPGGVRLLAWTLLALEGIELDTGSRSARVERVALQGPAARFARLGDGSTNLDGIGTGANAQEQDAAGEADQVAANDEPAVPGGDEPADGESTETSWSWSIGSATLDDGRLNFVDETLVIPFGTSVEAIDAALSDLSSANDAPTRIVLDGRVPPNGTMRIESLLTLLDPLDDAVFEVRFRQVAMPQLSPYTGNFAGRRIAGGRLDLDLSYRLDDRSLDAENRIVATALRLGPPVESKDAMDLPLELALALLRDSDDRIVLEIPVSGDIDDPTFDITPVIMSAIGNAVTGIVSAPFRMLGSLLGGGGDETIDRVLFPLGSATITDAEAARFVSLETALNQRPALRLVISPTRAPRADRDALRVDALRARIAAAATSGSAPAAADGVGNQPAGPIDPAAEAAALRTLYARDYGEEALAAIVAQYEEGDAGLGGSGGALQGELRGRLLADTRVTDDALDALARDRAQAVRDQLAAVGLDPARIRIRDAVVDGEVEDGGRRVIMKFDLAPGDAGEAAIEAP